MRKCESRGHLSHGSVLRTCVIVLFFVVLVGKSCVIVFNFVIGQSVNRSAENARLAYFTHCGGGAQFGLFALKPTYDCSPVQL
jgi:hypothetical protein